VAQKRKKAFRKKTSSSRTKKSRLTAANIEHLKQMLLEKRREILVNVNEMEGETLKKSRLDATGDLSSMPIHMADIGTDNYEQEFALGLMDSERKLLREIDDALRRIEEGTYGICEGTGKRVPKARLEAQPWARYCVEYAQMLEQGLVTEPEQQTSD
jgi:DnaK suppressor protein